MVESTITYMDENMTRSLIDLMFYGSIALSLPLAALVLWLWSRKVWKSAQRESNYSLSRIFIFMIPGIVLMVITVIPMFYALSLQKADEHCLAIFSAPQPEYMNKLSATDLKEKRLEEIRRSCPKTDYDDLFSRIK
jgi:ABC-type multidrug transport system permease subunit